MVTLPAYIQGILCNLAAHFPVIAQGLHRAGIVLHCCH